MWAAHQMSSVQEHQVRPRLSVRSLSSHVLRWRIGFLCPLRHRGELALVVHGASTWWACAERVLWLVALFMNEVDFVTHMQEVKLGWDPNPAPPLGTATSCLFPSSQLAGFGGQRSLTAVSRAVLIHARACTRTHSPAGVGGGERLWPHCGPQV